MTLSYFGQAQWVERLVKERSNPMQLAGRSLHMPGLEKQG